MTASELVENAGVPDRFQQVVIFFIWKRTKPESAMSIGRCDIRSLASRILAGSFVMETSRRVKRCSQILPRHVRDYIPYVITRACAVQRGPGAGDEVRPTAHSWLVDLRVFFSTSAPGQPSPTLHSERLRSRTIQ